MNHVASFLPGRSYQLYEREGVAINLNSSRVSRKLLEIALILDESRMERHGCC